jgi:hypothetical protein
MRDFMVEYIRERLLRRNDDAIDRFIAFTELMVKGQHKRAYEFLGQHHFERWCYKDGGEVLFGIGYQPLWERLPDGTVQVAGDRAHHGKQEILIYPSGRTLPYQQYEDMKRLRAILWEWVRGDRKLRRHFGLGHVMRRRPPGRLTKDRTGVDS